MSTAYGMTPAGMAADLDVVPLSVGRRVMARVVDGVLGLVLYLAVAATMLSGDGNLLVTAVVVWLAFQVVTLVTVLAVGSTPGQVALGARHVHITTGTKAGGATLLKYLVEAAVPLGLLIAVMSLQPPLNRSWFDRLAGVVLIDVKATLAYTQGQGGYQAYEGYQADHAPGGDDAHEGYDDDANRFPGEAYAPQGAAVEAQEQPLDDWWTDPRSPETAEGWTPQAGDEDGWPGGFAGDDDAVDDVTRISSDPAWGDARKTAPTPLKFDDGRTLYLDGPYVVGRNPVAPTGFADAAPYPVHDPDRSISKTHLVVGPAPEGVWVIDARSTNGVRIRGLQRTVSLGTGEHGTAEYGDVVQFGNRSFTVERPGGGVRR